MDPSIIRQHLALATRHVQEGEERVVRQREIVSELRRDGHDITQASQLLAQFESIQVIFVADRERLVGELAKTLSGKA